MVEIIYKNNDGLWVIQRETGVEKVSSLNQVWNAWLSKELTNLEGRLMSTARLLGRRRFIPLWVNSNLCLTVYPNHQAPNRLYINCQKIKRVDRVELESKITFESGHIHVINGPTETLMKRFTQTSKDTEIIRDFINTSGLLRPW